MGKKEGKKNIKTNKLNRIEDMPQYKWKLKRERPIEGQID